MKRETRGTSREKGRTGSIMGFKGAHASIPFQCERCWLFNLEGRLPADGLDDMYVTYIRQANLHAMGGRAKSTIEAHGAAVKLVCTKL
jgi:hypothetical protein